jgi:D-alanyl-D-alanine carboxypeptidase
VRLHHAFRPPLTSPTAILVDARTGTVLWARKPHDRRPIASTTKIMTALLAVQRLRPHALVTIDPSVPRAAPFREGLRAGERVQAWKLLYGLMLYSGNDDALALAIATAGSRPSFVKAMNLEARRLGLVDTHFSTPSGVVDRDNYSSAWDLGALTRYAMRNARFRTLVRTRIKRVPWPRPTFAKVYVNKNLLLGRYPGADGVKTGWTTLARHCLVASARRGKMQLIAVVLGATDPYRDARRLLNLGFRSFQS